MGSGDGVLVFADMFTEQKRERCERCERGHLGEPKAARHQRRYPPSVAKKEHLSQSQGDGPAPKPISFAILNDEKVMGLDCGAGHTVAITGARVYAWGAAQDGQCATGPQEGDRVPLPREIQDLTGKYVTQVIYPIPSLFAPSPRPPSIQCLLYCPSLRSLTLPPSRLPNPPSSCVLRPLSPDLPPVPWPPRWPVAAPIPSASQPLARSMPGDPTPTGSSEPAVSTPA